MPVAPPPKKSKVGRIILIILAAFVVLCLGGAAAIYFAVGDDVKDVVEAAQTRVVAPDTLGGKSKVADPELQQLADEMVSDLETDFSGATSTVGAFYGDPASQDLVMIVAVSGIMADPSKELEDVFDPEAGMAASNLTTVDPGPLGGEAKCGDGDIAEAQLGVCAWADRGSVGLIVVYFKTGEEAAADFVAYRNEIEQRS